MNEDLLYKEQFMVITSFKDRASTVVMSEINVERSKKKNDGSQAAAATVVIAENYNPFIMVVGNCLISCV